MHGSEDDRTDLSDGFGQAIDRGEYLWVDQRSLTDNYRRFDAPVVFVEDTGKPFEKRARLVIQQSNLVPLASKERATLNDQLFREPIRRLLCRGQRAPQS